MPSKPSLNNLPLDLKYEIIDHVCLQDAAYIERCGKRRNEDTFHGRGLFALSGTSRFWRKLTMKVLFSRKTFKTRNDSINFPEPLPNSRLPSLLLAVKSVKLEGTPIECLQAFPLLRKMKNLRELDLGGSKSFDPSSLITALVDKDDPDWNEPPEDPFDDWTTAREEELDRREARREEREERKYVRRSRPADYEDTTEEEETDYDEEDDDDEYSGNPYAPKKIKPEILKAVQEARQVLPAVIRRLESLTLGASNSEYDFLAIIRFLKDTRVKRLSFGLPSTKEDRKLRRQLHSIETPSFLSTVNELIGLEELIIGVANDLDPRLAKKKWKFAPTLRSLELHVATLTTNTIALISHFTSLTNLVLSFDELKPQVNASLPLPNLPSLPRLAHLSLTFRLPQSISNFDPISIISAFAAQANLRKITLELVPHSQPHSRPSQVNSVILPIFRKFLSPLSSSDPSLSHRCPTSLSPNQPATSSHLRSSPVHLAISGGLQSRSIYFPSNELEEKPRVMKILLRPWIISSLLSAKAMRGGSRSSKLRVWQNGR